jgi:pepF/M3 family oligoendopeptidase
MSKWNLNALYTDFNDQFIQDLEEAKQLINIASTVTFEHNEDAIKVISDYLEGDIELSLLIRKLYAYISLTLATDTTNKTARKYQVELSNELVKLSGIDTLFSNYLNSLENFNEIVNSTAFLKEHNFVLKEMKMNSRYRLDEETEQLVSKLAQSGSGLWNKQFTLLTSMHTVELDGEEYPLPSLLSMMSSPDGELRKKAYEAEINSYKSIEKPIAFSLNGIKQEVNTMTQKRGYSSALDHALSRSRMSSKTLDAMLDAMREYLPYFRTYLKRKAKLLGHDNGLPFYDLYAPLGSSSRTFTIEEAKSYIIKQFGTFSEHLKSLAQKAFDEDWVDFEPRKGKRGGAFCSNIPPIKASRVLLNFTGTFKNVITLAHELGHAYHGENIFDESILNASYTMPVAETASTFCETIVKTAAMKEASKEEEIFLLDSALQGHTQIIVDIMSRFIFESNVFKEVSNTFVDEEQLKEMMLDAQKQTYGEGLDPNFMHPYMWIWKPHYYSSALSYYNFPYAFGLLFAKGLYAKYIGQPDGFPERYDALLSMTGKASVEDIALEMGINVTDKEFWKQSLSVLKQDIDRFIEITE